MTSRAREPQPALQTEESLAARADLPAPLAGRTRRIGIGPFSGRHLSLIAAVVGSAGLLLLAITLPVGSDPASSLAPGQAEPTFYRVAAEGQGLSVGQSAPDFGDGQDGAPFLDLDDKPISMADFKGRPLWVAFWATWCPPCQQETPDLRATYEAHRNEGLQVLAVDVQEPPEAAREYARAYGLTYKIGVDATATVMKRYGVFGLPTHYFIDTDGIVRDRYFGPLTRDEMERRVALIGLKPPTWSDPP